MEDLKINPIKVTRNGKPRWYLQLAIPNDLRDLVGARQKRYSCGSGVQNHSQAMACIVGEVGQKIRNEVLEWRANFDPLIVSAEKLLEALYCRFSEEDKKLPEKDWLTGEVTKQRLQNLRTYGEKNSPERKEYNLLVNLLKMEVVKVLNPKVPLDKGNELTDFEGVRASLQKRFTDEEMRKVIDELVDGDGADASLNFEITRLHQGVGARAPRYGEEREPREIVNKKFEQADDLIWSDQYGVSVADIEQIRNVYKIIVAKFNSEKQDRVSEASNDFDDEHILKRKGIGRVGKKFSDACNGLWESPSTALSSSTEQEYKRAHTFFLENIGDLDLAQINMGIGIDYINLVLKKVKGRGQKLA